MMAKLSESDWAYVFTVRCRVKRGERVSAEDTALYEAAFREDQQRYGDMEPRIFRETAPFGSSLDADDETPAP